MAGRAKTAQSHSVVCIQEIRTQWTKQSRGGSGAVARNHVPEELPLPEVVSVKDSQTVLYHQVSYQEQGGFFDKFHDDLQVSKTIPTNLRGIRITLEEDSIKIDFAYTRQIGAPPRRSQPQTALVLKKEQWGRILYNGRHSTWEADWHYERHIFNIGLFTAPGPDVFITTAPVKIYSQMAHLF